MKDISIYFPDFALANEYKEGQVGKHIVRCSKKNFENPTKDSIAILFVPEYRNSQIKPNSEFINQFRNSFCNLFQGDWKSPIYDLGVVNPGSTVEDTNIALKEIITELVKSRVLPIIIGGSQDLTYAMYQAYEKLEQTINILDVDAALDVGIPDDQLSASNWLSKIIVHKPGYLFNYSLLGYQSYLVSNAEISLLNKMYFDSFRLGEFYSDEKMVEPLVRNADILSFDLNAIRGSDYRGNANAMPHGLYGEDACKIMRYAGWSDKLTSIGIFNYNQTISSVNDVNLLAQMIWYFVEGFNLRKKDYPVGSKAKYTKFTVSIDNFKDEIIFYKSDKTGRWWMEVPYPKIKGVKFQRHLLIPCNYDVYERALQNEMPDLWWKTFQKLT